MAGLVNPLLAGRRNDARLEGPVEANERRDTEAMAGRVADQGGRREEILTEAARLFAAHGYETTSMNQLAAAVGVSKSLIYHYFPSKTELLYLLHHRVLTAGLAMAKAAQQHESAAERFRGIIRGHIRLVLENVDANLVLQSARDRLPEDRDREVRRLRERYWEEVCRTYEDGVAEGSLRPVPKDLAVGAILAACNWLYRWRPEGPGLSIDEVADEFETLVGKGLFLGSADRECDPARLT